MEEASRSPQDIADNLAMLYRRYAEGVGFDAKKLDSELKRLQVPISVSDLTKENLSPRKAVTSDGKQERVMLFESVEGIHNYAMVPMRLGMDFAADTADGNIQIPYIKFDPKPNNKPYSIERVILLKLSPAQIGQLKEAIKLDQTPLALPRVN